MRSLKLPDGALSQGAWQTELKVADFRRVIELVTPALTSQTKDLQLAVWLAEALIKQHGFVGLRDGLQLMYGLQANFWDTLHPEIDEGDMEGRANAVGWLDEQGAFAVKGTAFTGSQGYSFRDFEDSKRFDFPENIDGLPGDERARFQELKNLAESGQRVTADLYERRSLKRGGSDGWINFTIEECLVAFEDLNRVVRKFDRNQMPGLSGFKKALEVHDEVKSFSRPSGRKSDSIYEEEVAGDGASGDGTGKSRREYRGDPDRRDALKHSLEIADFSSERAAQPVSYLVQRAVKGEICRSRRGCRM
jgi:type VI secretion system protein ImpA